MHACLFSILCKILHLAFVFFPFFHLKDNKRASVLSVFILLCVLPSIKNFIIIIYWDVVKKKEIQSCNNRKFCQVYKLTRFFIFWQSSLWLWADEGTGVLFPKGGCVPHMGHHAWWSDWSMACTGCNKDWSGNWDWNSSQ